VLARVFLIVFGLFCVGAGFHPKTTVGPAFSRGKGQLPVTRGQRVVFVVFGCLFVLDGVMGWMDCDDRPTSSTCRWFSVPDAA
jgi:hypothetical protein